MIPLQHICPDYFTHLTPEKPKMKIAAGQIDLPLIKLEETIREPAAPI